MDLLSVYGSEIPDFLCEAAETDVMSRLRDVGMNCGCEYTNFPRFRNLIGYSRFDHSLGVALIVWRHTHDRVQAMSGLLHDVSTPVFSHVVDFLKDDHLKQEATEAGTEERIRSSEALLAVLEKHGLTVDSVKDYHAYPIADNDSPKLSADRLEYSLGNMFNYRFADLDTVQRLYGDICVGQNECGEAELMFAHAECAFEFADCALSCAGVYVSDEDRYGMQRLAELLRGAIEIGVIGTEDLDGTEPVIIEKLMANPLTAEQWRRFCALHRMEVSHETEQTGDWKKIFAKKRCIDPYVKGQGRVSKLNTDFAQKLHAFQTNSQDYWVRGR